MDTVLLEALLASAVTLGAASPHDAAWRRGDIEHVLHAGQKKLNDVFDTCPHQLQVWLCGRGNGKTYFGAAKSASIGIKRKARIKIATEFGTDLENLLIPNFEKALSTCPEDIAPRWMPSKNRYVFDHNGSRIDLIGLDKKPQGLRGTHDIDLILLEEAGFITKLKQIYLSVILPILTHRKDCKVILVSTPPESVDHYFWTLVEIAEAAGSLTIQTIDDNPMLGPEDVKRVEALYDIKDASGNVIVPGRKTTQFRREYLCEKVSEENRLLVPEFDKNAHVAEIAHDDYFQFYLKSNALDSGVRDLTTSLWGYYDFKQAKLMIEGEMALGGKDVLTSRIFSRSREIEDELGYRRVRRHADNNNLILIQDLNDLAHKAKLDSGFTILELQKLAEQNRLPEGMSVAPEHVHWMPTRKDSVEASINLVREWFKQGRIVVAPSCKHLIGTLKGSLWNKQRTDFERSEVYGHADAIMSLVYLIRNLDVHTNPIPATYGADLNNSVVFVRKQQSENASALASAFGIKRR